MLIRTDALIILIRPCQQQVIAEPYPHPFTIAVEN
jgi:hypothetical protein